jgi:protein-disulfide isomerase
MIRNCMLLILIIFFPFFCFSIEKLNEKYLIVFGDVKAPVQFTQYFSLACPHCLSLFKTDFKIIKEKYIDQKKALWIFHPVPLDSLTVQAMDCFSKLSEKQKRIFFEALFDTLHVQDGSEVVIFLMQEAMKTFHAPIEQLDDKEYIIQTQAFQDAFSFIKQEKGIDAVPAIEVDGILYRKSLPTQSFIDKQMHIRMSDE